MILRFLPLLALGLVASAASADLATGVGPVVTTTLGAFRFEFFPDEAPKHIEQFFRLARRGNYDSSAFHRAVLNAVLRGGDPPLKDLNTPRDRWGTL